MPNFDHTLDAMRRKTVVYIEEGSEVDQLVNQTLEKSAYQIIPLTFSDTLAVEIANIKPDLIILGLSSSNRNMRRNFVQTWDWEKIKDIPILVITYQSERDDYIPGLPTILAATMDYIVYPFDTFALSQRVHTLIEHKSLRLQ